MPKRTASSSNEEPEQKKFELPSAKEHLFQVVDFVDMKEPDPDIMLTKIEVVGGDEEGRSLLQRLSLDDKWKGFFATRLFLKAIGEPYKGNDFPIDTENWIGRQFYATIEHAEYKGKNYANIDEYNFDKPVEQVNTNPNTTEAKATPEEVAAWDE